MVTEAGTYSVNLCNDATTPTLIISGVKLRGSGHWAFGIALVLHRQSMHPITRVIIACAER